MRREAKPGKAKVEAKQSGARKSRKNEGSGVRQLQKRLAEAHGQLTEAREQQTATSEVLKVISRSTFDLQPVLDTLIENAARLCDARRGVILRRDGDSYHGVAFYNASPELVDFVRRHPVTPGRRSITGRVALERHTIQVADLQADPEYGYALLDVDPIRTELGVPMFRGDDILGVIILYKVEVQPFTDKQIELVETFADQAVIAIENVRLFKELEAKNLTLAEAHAQVTEALDQQTATAEILRVISSSPTEVQPVLDAIAERSVRLCGALFSSVYRFDGELIRGGPRARRATGRRVHGPGVGGASGLQGRSVGANAAGRNANGRCYGLARRGRRVHRQAHCIAPDVRRPSRHRHRERSAVHGAPGKEPRPHRCSCAGHRVSRATDGNERDPSGDQQLADQCPAGVRCDRRERRAALQRRGRVHRPRRGRRATGGGRHRPARGADPGLQRAPHADQSHVGGRTSHRRSCHDSHRRPAWRAGDRVP